MNIVVLGFGRMGSWLAGELARTHRVFVFDKNPHQTRGASRVEVLNRPDEIAGLKPGWLINAVDLAGTVEAFREDLEAHGGSAERITEACCDMSQAFIRGLKAEFPNAHLTFDRFHVMQLANKGVDDVRRMEARERPELKRSRYVWLKNRSNLSARQRERLEELQGMNLNTAEAYRMRLTLQDFYEQANPRAAAMFLADWCEMVLDSGLEPMKKVARTLMDHAEGVLRWFWSGFSNGLLEGINSLIQAAKAKARGYRTTRNLLNIAYLIAGKLDFALPVR